jgi:alpha-galactosidase
MNFNKRNKSLLEFPFFDLEFKGSRFIFSKDRPMQTILFENFQIISYSDQIKSIPGGYILTGSNVSLEFERQPQGYYRHGWQSWGLTAWLDPQFQLPVQKPTLLHLMQTDPLYVNYHAPNGAWLGAVEFEDGKILLLGALGLEAHVALHGDQTRSDAAQLHGWYDAGPGEWFVAFGREESVFTAYVNILGERFGKTKKGKSPRVWCSWYSLYTAIDEPLLYRVFDELGDLPFDVLQVDDGWQVSVGDWQPNAKFPSGMEMLAQKIKTTGRRAGLWLAPLIALKSSQLFRTHPDWFLRDAGGTITSAGFNWGEPFYALDTTHPAVLEWLAALMKQVRAWGFDYLKLDFLFAGALPGQRYQNMPREAAYRQGLKVIQESMGEDAYSLTCGAPILPSLGLCDAMRIGPDVSEEWENYRDARLLYNPTTPGARNAIRTSVNRLWLKPLVHTDPDVAYFCSIQNSLSIDQRLLLQDLALVCDFKATSDPPQWLNETEHDQLYAFLESKPVVERTGRYRFSLDGREVDFGPAVLLPGAPKGFETLASAAMGWLGNQGWALKLFDQQRKRALQKKLKDLYKY